MGGEAEAPLPGLLEAVRAAKAGVRARFDESVDLALGLGIDPRRTEQNVRGGVALPHGTGRQVRVAAFAEGAAAEAARAAGAELVGGAELVAEVRAGTAPKFDAAVATPGMMGELGAVARVLGPKGLMPNKKLGTVAEDLGAVVGELKRGRAKFRSEKAAIVHCSIGRASFADEALVENAGALVGALLAQRPKGVKGSGINHFIKRAHVSTTMGPGFPLCVESLGDAHSSFSAAQGGGE